MPESCWRRRALAFDAGGAYRVACCRVGLGTIFWPPPQRIAPFLKQPPRLPSCRSSILRNGAKLQQTRAGMRDEKVTATQILISEFRLAAVFVQFLMCYLNSDNLLTCGLTNFEPVTTRGVPGEPYPNRKTLPCRAASVPLFRTHSRSSAVFLQRYLRLAVPTTRANATRDSPIPIKNAGRRGKRSRRRAKRKPMPYHASCAKPTTRGIETTESSTETTTVSTA